MGPVASIGALGMCGPNVVGPCMGWALVGPICVNYLFFAPNKYSSSILFIEHNSL